MSDVVKVLDYKRELPAGQAHRHSTRMRDVCGCLACPLEAYLHPTFAIGRFDVMPQGWASDGDIAPGTAGGHGVDLALQSKASFGRDYFSGRARVSIRPGQVRATGTLVTVGTVASQVMCKRGRMAEATEATYLLAADCSPDSDMIAS